MTTRELDEIGAEPVTSDSFRPLRANQLVIATDDVRTRDTRKLGKREWQGIRVSRLRSKPSDSAKPLPPTGIQKVRLIAQLVEHAPSNRGHQGAQIHQMPRRSSRCDQRNRVTAIRMPYDHEILIEPIECRAHNVGVGVEACRSILGRQLHSDYVMTRLLEKRNKQLP
jgi:hypothetical protein